ncbi:MAG: DUF2703 domain-containing protein [Armatimonadota bacterium]
MSELLVKWIRLSVDGETCHRCRETGKEVSKAVEILSLILSPLNIKVTLEEVEITLNEFAQNPLMSNEIWLNGRLLEDWLGAKTTRTPCCDVCGDEECRALEIDGQLQEVVAAELIVKAGLIAASELLNESDCCPERTSRCVSCCE